MEHRVTGQLPRPLVATTRQQVGAAGWVTNARGQLLVVREWRDAVVDNTTTTTTQAAAAAPADGARGGGGGGGGDAGGAGDAGDAAPPRRRRFPSVQWKLPGGMCDAGESFGAAAAREVFASRRRRACVRATVTMQWLRRPLLM